MLVSLSIDDRAWQAAVDAWMEAAHREGVAANEEAAKKVQERTRQLLSIYHHAPETRTPSPEGEPPAMISGRLAASIDVQRDGDDSLVGPTDAASSDNGPYGRFLEMGGDHIAHNIFGEMWWREDGRWYHKPSIKKESRPYLSRATEELIDSGAITRTYYDHWLLAQEEVTA